MAHVATGWRWLAARLRTPSGVQMAVLLGIALTVRLPLLPYDGLTGDLQIFANWGAGINRHPLQVYALTPGYPVNYPPPMLYVYGLLIAAYRLVAPALLGHQPTYQLAADPWLAPVMKLPTLAADLAMVALLAVVARRAVGQRAAFALTLAYALSPAILLAGVVWGQADAVSALAIALALLLAPRGRPAWIGALLSAALLLKPQAIIFLPLAMLWLWRWRGRRAAAVAGAALVATAVALCLPYLLPPHFDIQHLVADEGAVLRFQPYATINAFNLWALLGLPHHPYDAPLLGPLTPNVIGLALFAAIYLVAGIGVWRRGDRAMLFLAAAIVAVAFFDVTTLQRERYLFPAVPLLFIAACAVPRLWPLYATTSATLFLNMFFTAIPYPTDARPFWLISPAAAQLALAGGWIMAAVTAVINLALLALALRAYAVRTLRGPWQPKAAAQPSATSPGRSHRLSPPATTLPNDG